MDFETAIDHRLSQILFHGEPGLGAGVHGRLEEAMGAASFGLGGVHRQIGVLDQLIEIGAVLRRQRDADAGIGGEMMTEAPAGLPDRVVDPRHEFYRVGDIAPDPKTLVVVNCAGKVGNWGEKPRPVDGIRKSSNVVKISQTSQRPSLRGTDHPPLCNRGPLHRSKKQNIWTLA